MWLLLPFLLVAFGVLHDSAVQADICPPGTISIFMPGELNTPPRSAFFLGLDPSIPGKNPFDATKRPGKNSKLKITENHKFFIIRSPKPTSLFRVVDLCLNVKKAVNVTATYAINAGIIVIINEVIVIPIANRKKFKKVCFTFPVPPGVGHFGQERVVRIWISFTTTNAWWNKIEVKKMFMEACLPSS